MVDFVYIGNIEFCPYMKTYQNILESQNITYQVLFWRRQDFHTKFPYNYKYFDYPTVLNKKKTDKIREFFLYQKWLLKQLHTDTLDKIIILDTLSGILLQKTLLTEFPGRYIMNIRDYSYEKWMIFRYFEKKIIRHSYMTCISSDGFKAFLPDWNYSLAHNCNFKEKTNHYCFKPKKLNEVLNVVFIGSIRYYSHQMQIIQKLANKKQFKIIYHGTGPDYDKLKRCCEELNITNILFTGKYKEDEKEILLKNADILLNSYDIRVGDEVKYAVSNKYYDGILYHIPQISESNSYKADLIMNFQIGIALDADNPEYSEKLFHYYHSIHVDRFNKKCNQLWEIYYQKNENYLNDIRLFLNS